MQIKKVIFVSVVMLLAVSAFSQRGMGYNSCRMNMIPDLDEEQEQKIEDLRVEHMKKMLPLRNEMQEKKARLHTMMTSEEVDMDAIDQQIDEIGELHVKMLKERTGHKQNVRALLNDEQRIIYDMHFMHFRQGQGKGCGFGKGNRGRKGRGYGFGRGQGRMMNQMIDEE